jgi:GTPase SAR1 family protein
MGKKKTKVSTADMGDADQIEFKEASDVPVAEKKDIPATTAVAKGDAKPIAQADNLVKPNVLAEKPAKIIAPIEKPAKINISPEKPANLEKPVKEPAKKEEKPEVPVKKIDAPASEAKEGKRMSVDEAMAELDQLDESEDLAKAGKKPKKQLIKKKPAKEQKTETKQEAPAKVKATSAPEKVVDDLEFPELVDEDKLESPDLIGSMKAQESKPHEAWKILFSGLDFAGKSSIIATVKNEFEKIVNPQPTKLTERSEFTFLGQSIHDWDMGGQRLYRIQYLKRPMVYYVDTSILFYVIDVLDEERYDEAIDFLYDTLQLFDKLNVNPLISVMFHKYDPDVERDSKKNRVELKITALMNKIKVLAYGRDVMFFRTSIFNRYTVIEAFSKSLLQLFPDKNVVDYALQELATKTNANIIIILDEKRNLLGQNIVASSDIQYEELVKLAQNTLLSFLYLNENFQFYPFLKSNYIIIQLERYSFLFSQIEENGHLFYVIVFKDGANFDQLLKMDVQSVAKTLIKLLKT